MNGKVFVAVRHGWFRYPNHFFVRDEVSEFVHDQFGVGFGVCFVEHDVLGSGFFGGIVTTSCVPDTRPYHCYTSSSESCSGIG